MNTDEPIVFDGFSEENGLSLNNGSIIVKNPETKVCTGEISGVLLTFQRAHIPLRNVRLSITPDSTVPVSFWTHTSPEPQSEVLSIDGIDLYNSSIASTLFCVRPKAEGMLQFTANLSFFIADQKEFNFSQRFAFQVIPPFLSSSRVRQIGPNLLIAEISLYNSREPISDVQVTMQPLSQYHCDNPTSSLYPILNYRSIIRSLFSVIIKIPQEFAQNIGTYSVKWTTSDGSQFSSSIEDQPVKLKDPPRTPTSLHFALHESPAIVHVCQPFSFSLSVLNVSNVTQKFFAGVESNERCGIVEASDVEWYELEPGEKTVVKLEAICVKEGNWALPQVKFLYENSAISYHSPVGGIVVYAN